MSLERWRLILGQSAEVGLGCSLSGESLACDAALSWLYDREAELEQRQIRTRSAGQEESSLSVAAWIEQIHQLFPNEVIERLERDAVERYQIHEVVTNPEILERVEPSQAMLAAVLRTRHLMNQELLTLARQLVARVVEQLMAKLARELETALCTGQRQRRSQPRPTPLVDLPRSLSKNLRHVQKTDEVLQLVLKQLYFFPRQQRRRLPWQLILLVDQSGSMVNSVIHSAVTAACLWSVPSLKTHLVAFDTAVVDLTSEVSDPVELLMKVQLGGGTDIAQAVTYAASLIEQPRRTIVAVITDFFEGGDGARLLRLVGQLASQGTHVLGLASLDEEDTPCYDQQMAQAWVEQGAHVAAMTPGQLANWIGQKVLGS